MDNCDYVDRDDLIDKVASLEKELDTERGVAGRLRAALEAARGEITEALDATRNES